jgi:DNA-binding transcriptional regulator LsrR (DeoR family)
VDDTEREQLTAIARAFYLEDVSKVELAASYGVSRFKIARMLQQAREEGIVTIEIHGDDGHRDRTAQALTRHLRLQETIVVPAGDTEEDDRRRMARAAAGYLTRTTDAGDVLGFSWGRTIVAIGEYLNDLPPSTVVQLTGTVGNDLTQSPVEVIRRIAVRSHVEAVAVFSPLFAATAQAAHALREDPSIAAALDRYHDLTTAVLSVGSWNPPVTQLADFLSARDRAQLDQHAAVAEMAGIFLDASGRAVDADLTDRRIAVSIPQLLATPRVVAVAGSAAKVGAIHAAARSGLITTLITDEATARRLQELPPVEDVAHPRPAADAPRTA